MEADNLPEVICEVCKKSYGTGCSRTQAPDCAAHYADGFIYGHYESDFDIQKIRLTGVDLPRVVDPVCDDCIRGWIAEGKAYAVGEFCDFDAFGELPLNCELCQAHTPTSKERFKLAVFDDNGRASYLSLCLSCFEKRNDRGVA